MHIHEHKRCKRNGSVYYSFIIHPNTLTRQLKYFNKKSNSLVIDLHGLFSLITTNKEKRKFNDRF